MLHGTPTLFFFFPSLFPFLSLPIDSEKNDRWRKWRKNVWNTGQVPRWGKIGTQRVTFTGIKQTRKIMWNGEMMGCSFCNDNLYHFFPLDLLVLLAYIKKKYVLRKKKNCFVSWFLWCIINQAVVDEVLHSVQQEMDPAYFCSGIPKQSA